MTNSAKSIWSAWADYGATGEGNTWLLWIGYAEDSTKAKASFQTHFGEFMTRFCETEKGVVRNNVTELLLPIETAERLVKSEFRANIEFSAQMRVNAA